MRGALVLAITLGAIAGCGRPAGEPPVPEPAPVVPTPAPDPTPDPTPIPTPDPASADPAGPVPAPSLMSSAECEAKAGLVRGDIGDGKIKCADDERELGRVRTGIEGGVCCSPAAPASR